MATDTKKESIIEEINGITITDPHRWLENPNDPDVESWIQTQNKQVDSSLKNSYYTQFSEELARNFKFISFSNSVTVGGRNFYTERQPDEDQYVLYMKKGLDGAPIKIYDPNGKENDNTTTIDYWDESRTGNYIAYGISKGGDEMATLNIKNTETNLELPEKIPHCRYSSIVWLPDDSGFFYTRNPWPGTVSKNEEHLYTKVYLHKLHTDPKNDELIFGNNRPKDDMIGLGLSLDGNYLSINVSQKWTENEIYLYDCGSKEVKPLIVNSTSIFSLLFIKDKVLLETNYKANNYRVLWTTYQDLFKPLDQWKEFIPERSFLLETLTITKNKILAEYLVNACSEVIEFDYHGREIGKIPLPKYSSLAGISGRRDEEEFFYGVSSFLFPKIVYRYDPATAKYLEYRRIDNLIDPVDYEVKQVWYTSKDTTQVPMFIFHKKGIKLEGSNPTILYGYGGFGSNETPGFMRNWIPWVKRGGVFAIANIRGGGEFGDSWHKNGIKEHKQNSFDDFIAAGEYLIEKKYTSQAKLGILGASNGGLLVSAVGVQRPDLFKAVCARVPLTDMVRFPKFGIAVRWIHEYGNPEVKNDLEKILMWSPYHNVKDTVKYPHFFFTTANKDTRVDPLHSRKMAAKLQENKENNVLVYTEMESGHGAGKPIIKIVESQALVLSFFASNLY